MTPKTLTCYLGAEDSCLHTASSVRTCTYYSLLFHINLFQSLPYNCFWAVLRGCLLHELYHSSGSPLRPSCNLLMQAAQVFPPENECINSLPPVTVTVTVSWCIQYVSCILITLITSYWKTMKNDRKDLPRIQWRISRSTRPCRRACAILTLNRSSYVSLGRSSAQAHRDPYSKALRQRNYMKFNWNYMMEISGNEWEWMEKQTSKTFRGPQPQCA